MDRVSCAQNGKDATSICIPQYKEAFFRLMSSGGELWFANCKWTDAEVKQLAAALQCAHAEGATSQADVLDLERRLALGEARPAKMVDDRAPHVLLAVSVCHVDW